MPLTKVTPPNLHQTVKTMVTTMVNETAVDSADVVTLINANAIDSADAVTLINANAIDSADATLIINSNIAAKSTSDLSEGTNLYYTDARADARVSLIVDAAPSTLNTLNELAAALGDDANFSTTVTNSIATKLPLAGGTMTGALIVDAGDAGLDVRLGTDKRIIFAGNIGEIGSVAGFQAVNTAGSANTAFGIRATDIRFATGSDERVRITDAGVGIGTSSPYTLLELSSIDPILRFNDSNGGTDTKNFELRYVGTNSPDIDGLYFRTVNDANTVYSDKMTILGNGNVGIGNNSPQSSLAVYSSSASAYSSTVDSTTNMSGIRVTASPNESVMTGIWFGTGNDQTGTHWTGIAGSRTNHTADWGTRLSFYTHPTATTSASQTYERMTIDPAGNVGIGTTNPEQNLHIKRASGSDTGGQGHILLDVADDSGPAYALRIGDTADDGDFHIDRRFSVTWSPSLSIDRATGNVGIGTTSPTAKLHTRETTSNTISAATAGVKFDGSGGDGLAFGNMASSPYASWIQAGYLADGYSPAFNNGYPIALNPIGGNVGIGTTNPQQLLHLESNSSRETRIQFKSDNLGGSHGIFWVDENAVNQSQFYYNHSSNKQFLELNGNGLQIYSKQTSSAIAEFGSSAGGYNNFSIPNGSVGIGTSNPGEKLTVEGSAANIRLYNNGGSGTSLIMLDTSWQGGINMYQGNLNFKTGGQTTRWTIETTGNLVPATNDAVDIGSTNAVVRNIYTGDLHLSNENKTEGNSVDGTKGNWTIQEGEEDLFIINNKTGKKYAFVLREIE